MRRRHVIGIFALTFAFHLTAGPAALAQSGITIRMSVSSSGKQANGYSHYPSISANGRYVAFESDASNLVANDTNAQRDVFVRDRIAKTTTRVSTSSTGTQSSGGSAYASISSDGRYVAFNSAASNLVPNDTNAVPDVFVRDTVANTTIRASVSSIGAQGNGRSAFAAISQDGRHVAFESNASNLVDGDSGGWTDIFVHDLQTRKTVRTSVGFSGTEAHGWSSEVSISADGRFVAFASNAPDIVPGDVNPPSIRRKMCDEFILLVCATDPLEVDVFVHDRDADRDGVFDEPAATSNAQVSVSTEGLPANGVSALPSISANGRYVTFHSDATTLDKRLLGESIQVFVRDRDTDADNVFDEPAAVSTQLASAAANGQIANSTSYVPSISPNGRFVVFESWATNLAEGTGGRQVFVKDLESGQVVKASVSSTGQEANWTGTLQSLCFCAVLAGDGSVVAFESQATNLVSNDTNNSPDVFAHFI